MHVAMLGCGLLPRHSSWLAAGRRGLRAARLVRLLVASPQPALSVKLLHGLAEVISGKVGQDGELGKEGEVEGGERLNVGHREFLARQPQKKKKKVIIQKIAGDAGEREVWQQCAPCCSVRGSPGGVQCACPCSTSSGPGCVPQGPEVMPSL